MKNNCNSCNSCNDSKQQQNEVLCPVPSTQQIPVADHFIPLCETPNQHPTFKVPVVLAERSLQIVVEANIPLDPRATEIKRVTKNVFLKQVKLVPVRFDEIDGTDFFEVKKAKLFVSGFIRKNIEYSSRDCQGVIHDRIVEVPFYGFAELKHDDFLTKPIIGMSDSDKAFFLNDTNGEVPRLDKYFFQNSVKYNEQPYGELLGANFYELDFSPVTVEPEAEFSPLREKIVVDIFLKVLQVQQFKVHATRIIPNLDNGLG